MGRETTHTDNLVFAFINKTTKFIASNKHNIIWCFKDITSCKRMLFVQRADDCRVYQHWRRLWTQIQTTISTVLRTVVLACTHHVFVLKGRHTHPSHCWDCGNANMRIRMSSGLSVSLGLNHNIDKHSPTPWWFANQHWGKTCLRQQRLCPLIIWNM